MSNVPETPILSNPFRPGAGHMPPYLAGRDNEQQDFERLLAQETILDNLILTGLRGIGKTVLLETFKPRAIASGWLWVGTDLSESSSVSEENLALRLLTDLAVVTSHHVVHEQSRLGIGFLAAATSDKVTLNFNTLHHLYTSTPGLVADKLKYVLEFAWEILAHGGKKGLIFAYDEAQNMGDHAPKDQYPLSLLLDVFQSIQRKSIPFMLVLTGLPTLFPKLVEARTYAERMFRVIFLEPLSQAETEQAISVPIQKGQSPLTFRSESIHAIWSATKGYPYFVQYVCREIFDIWVQNYNNGQPLAPVPIPEITAKLDTDFFAGRWARATDRQQDLMVVIASLSNADAQFSVRDIEDSASNRQQVKPFSNSHINQMLSALCQSGLIYKNRHGRYSFAVPMLADFIRRQELLGK